MVRLRGYYVFAAEQRTRCCPSTIQKHFGQSFLRQPQSRFTNKKMGFFNENTKKIEPSEKQKKMKKVYLALIPTRNAAQGINLGSVQNYRISESGIGPNPSPQVPSTEGRRAIAYCRSAHSPPLEIRISISIKAKAETGKQPPLPHPGGTGRELLEGPCGADPPPPRRN